MAFQLLNPHGESSVEKRNGGGFMKIKVSNNTLTFKLKKDELEQLIQGETIQTGITLGSTQIACVLSKLDEDQGHSEKPQFKFFSIEQELHAFFQVPIKVFQSLFEMGRNREGLHIDLEKTRIVLQLDVRS
jgi:hypothetical protein